jgi:GTP-binding protein EngB required for normal cell division
MKSSMRPDASELIGKCLKKYYGEITAQTLPEQFEVLLAKLDKVTSKKQEKQSRERPQ